MFSLKIINEPFAWVWLDKSKLVVLCILIFFSTPQALLYSQSIQIQGVVSGSHGELSNESIRLSGAFGQPIASTDPGILQSGFYSSITGLITANLAPLIVIKAVDQVLQFDITSAPSISADVTDLDGIDYAAMWVRPIGGTSFDSLAMTPGSGDKYSVTVSSGNYDEMGIEYYLVANDNTDRWSRYPGANTLYAYGTNPQVTFPNNLISPGSKEVDYPDDISTLSDQSKCGR